MMVFLHYILLNADHSLALTAVILVELCTSRYESSAEVNTGFTLFVRQFA